MKEHKDRVVKSTIPVGTARQFTDELRKETNIEFDVVANLERDCSAGSALGNGAVAKAAEPGAWSESGSMHE